MLFSKGEFARAPPLLRHNARRRLHVTSPRNSMSEFLTLGKSQTLPELEDFEHRSMHSPPGLAVSPPKGAEPSQRLLGGSPAKWAGSPSWPKHALNDANRVRPPLHTLENAQEVFMQEFQVRARTYPAPNARAFARQKIS